MHIENGKLVPDRQPCANCDHGKMPTKTPCPACKGTGKGKRGGKGSCKTCHGVKYTWDHDKLITCIVCQGNYENFLPEDLYDYFPKEVWQSLTFKVYRQNRDISGNESLLGFGCVYSCSDYGSAWEGSDATLIADVMKSSSHQGVKIAKEDGTLCDHIGIFVSRGGYSVRAVFNLAVTEATINHERPEAEYQAVAAKIYEKGGNGTLGALYKP